MSPVRVIFDEPRQYLAEDLDFYQHELVADCLPKKVGEQ